MLSKSYLAGFGGWRDNATSVEKGMLVLAEAIRRVRESYCNGFMSGAPRLRLTCKSTSISRAVKYNRLPKEEHGKVRMSRGRRWHSERVAKCEHVKIGN